jgi:uncharacterized membrane protein YfcA
MLQGLDFVLIALAAVAAGAVNALAGGGTLITFPVLTAVGLPAVAANITNTVALLPGYFGATLAQRKDLRGQEHRLWWAAPAGLIGGLIGGILLLRTGEKLFRDLVPYLILLASGLLAVQEPLRRWLVRRMADRQHSGTSHERWAALPLGMAAVYGGYFGAGLSVIILAVLAVVLEDNLTRLNGLKQAVALSTNVAAAIFFLFSGQVVWLAAAVMMVGALTGGIIGGKLAGRIKPAQLRLVVVVIGVVVAVLYLIR